MLNFIILAKLFIILCLPKSILKEAGVCCSQNSATSFANEARQNKAPEEPKFYYSKKGQPRKLIFGM